MANPTKAVPRYVVPYTEEVIERDLAATNQTYYPTEMIGLNSAGYATKFDDTDSLKFLGINAESVRIDVTSDHAAGDKRIKVERPRFFSMKIAACEITDVGKPVYVAYSDEVSFDPGTYGNLVGHVVKIESATEVLIEPVDFSGGLESRFQYHELFDDFEHFVSGDDFTTVASDSGTVLDGDAANGVVTLTASDGTVADNDETYLKGTHETFLFADGKPIEVRARVQCTEQNTDDANLMVGLMSGVAANSLQDDGAGPKADYSGIVFFKVDGGTVWQGEASVSTTQQTDTDVGAFTSGSWHDLAIIVEVTDAGDDTAIAKFYVDGVLGGTLTFDYTGATEMQAVLAVKNGGANNESLLVDYFYARQKR